MSEASPGLFKVSGAGQLTEVTLKRLEITLAGTLLLTEYDHCYRRIFTWLWQFWLRNWTSEVFQAKEEIRDLVHPGTGNHFWMSGGSPEVRIHESILERKWSGRLFIARQRNSCCALIGYLWTDIREGFAGVFNC